MIAAAWADIAAFQAPLAANIGDWVTWIVVAVVIVVSFLNQLLTDAAKKKPPQMPRRPGGGANPGGGGQKSLLDEVEKFLQEARNQTSQSHQRPQQQQPQQEARPQQQMSRSLPSQQKPPQQQSKKKQRREQQRREQQQPQRLAESRRSSLAPEADPMEELRGGGTDLSRLSGQHLQTSRFDERAERLSHLQQTVEADIGSHVQHAFDHRVGSLASAPSTAATAGASTDAMNPALQLIALLGDPNGIRNAVLMHEILEPPTHRW